MATAAPRPDAEFIFHVIGAGFEGSGRKDQMIDATGRDHGNRSFYFFFFTSGRNSGSEPNRGAFPGAQVPTETSTALAPGRKIRALEIKVIPGIGAEGETALSRSSAEAFRKNLQAQS
jgi:hypothetical protein